MITKKTRLMSAFAVLLMLVSMLAMIVLPQVRQPILTMTAASENRTLANPAASFNGLNLRPYKKISCILS